MIGDLGMKQFSAMWFFPLWLASLACGVGLLSFAGLPWLGTIFFPLGYIAVLCALLTTIHVWHDWLNPLSLIIFVGFVRFTIPGIWIWFTEADMRISDVPIFRIMGLGSEQWMHGHMLALLGLLGVTIGWLMLGHTDESRVFQMYKRSRPYLSGGIAYSAVVGVFLGLVSLFIFVQSNVSITEAVDSGAFRATQVQQGTGKYFYLSFMLISSSVILTDYFFSRKHAWWLSLAPVTVAMVAFFVLGGRMRSLTSMTAGLLVLRAWRSNAKLSPAAILGLVSIIVLLSMFFFVGGVYRGGAGLAGVSQILSLAAILEYSQQAVLIEYGQLQALAGAAAMDPGVLRGSTFLELLWPLTKLFDFGGKSAGVFIVQELVGLGDRKWGFHATLIGDAYLNFGLIGVIVVTIIFAMILKIIYMGFRERAIGNALYALALVYSLRMFFESIEKYGEALAILAFAYVIFYIGEIFSRMARGKASP